MKVRTKFLLAIGTLPLLLLLLFLLSWFQVVHISKANNEIKSNYDMSILAGQIRADVKDEGIFLRNIVLFNHQDSINDQIAELKLEGQKVNDQIEKLNSNVTTAEQKELVEQLIKVNSDFQLYRDQVVELIQENRKEEAISLMDENSAPLHQEFSDLLAEITVTYDHILAVTLEEKVKNFRDLIIVSCGILAIVVIGIMIILLRNIIPFTKRVSSMSNLMNNISNGHVELTTKVEIIANNEFDEMAKAFNQMTETLETQMTIEKELTWKNSNIAEISTAITGTTELESLGCVLLSKVVPLVESSHAVFYVKDLDDPSNETYKLVSSYASKERKLVKNTLSIGEGLIGQAILEKTPIILTDVPADYISVSSGLGEAKPLNLYIYPIRFEDHVIAVLELASFHPYTETQKGFLEELMRHLGIVLDSTISRIQLAKLLEESQTLMEEIQAQSEELQNQQEELKATNEELEEQTQALRQSEVKLQQQQEELEQTNTELEEKAKRLEEQNIAFERTNREVEKAKAELEIKAEQLALSSKYKSEFLANMSHELRTPLNSLIILSKLLADNPNGNLSPKQVEYSKTIYSSGNDLLVLINNILDLAKIESGKTEIIPGVVNLNNLVEYVEANFKPLAENKHINFDVIVKSATPQTIFSDEVRIQQILKNLLSNAFKFTNQGEVKLEIGVHSLSNLGSNEMILEFSVIDTGIGIPKEKQDLIFEAFQQADGTTSRKFGGTGLGLSISRELATLLGGKILLESEEGKGSKFSLLIGNYVVVQDETDTMTEKEAATTIFIDSEQHKLHPQLEAPKKDVSTYEGTPKNNEIKRLLIVDDDLNQRNSIMELIGDMDFIIKAVSTGTKAIELLKVNPFDCIILDLGLTDTSGFDLLEEIKKQDHRDEIQVFIYTGRDLTSKEEMKLNKYAHTIIIKNEYSPERLKAELEIYLKEHECSAEEYIDEIGYFSTNSDLKGKKILLVDDDIRNVFALSSVLESAGMEVIFAENGLESLKMLEDNPDVDLVLMDIMMPVMDGYEAIQRIRENSEFIQLPIIALTAKAMREDRDKCLSIGASDYIAKPVEPDQLISLIKVWLY
ncbi:response regulator [Ureibacillus sp. NPDC094379]